MAHKLLETIILALILGQMALVGFAYTQYAVRSPGRFFSAQANNQVQELAWLYKPNANTKALLSWATTAVTGTFTLDFVNYEQSLAALKSYFTEDGFDSFLLSLNENNTLQTILDKKLVLSAVPIGPAIVSSEDEVRGFHKWQVEIPLAVSYLSASEEQKSNMLVSILITQVPTQEASTGIGISRYIAVNLSPDVMR